MNTPSKPARAAMRAESASYTPGMTNGFPSRRRARISAALLRMETPPRPRGASPAPVAGQSSKAAAPSRTVFSSELVDETQSRLRAPAVQTAEAPGLEVDLLRRVDDEALRQVHAQVGRHEPVDAPDRLLAIAVDRIEQIDERRDDTAAAGEADHGESEEGLPAVDLVTVGERRVLVDRLREGRGGWAARWSLCTFAPVG